MDAVPGYKNVEQFRGGVQWYLMECKDITSKVSFKLKTANGKLVSLNEQSISFQLSITEF